MGRRSGWRTSRGRERLGSSEEHTLYPPASGVGGAKGYAGSCPAFKVATATPSREEEPLPPRAVARQRFDNSTEAATRRALDLPRPVVREPKHVDLSVSGSSAVRLVDLSRL